jgi:type IV pilus assembly protein PilO
VRRPIILVTVVVVALVAAGWYALLIRPQSARLSEMESKATTLQSQQAGLEARLTALKKAEQSQPQRLATLAQLTSAIPPTTDIADFINQVNALAGTSGVALHSLSPSQPAASKTGPYSEVNVSLSLTGSYSSTISFLDGLYSLPRLVVVDTLNISAGGGGGTSSSPSTPVSVPGATGSSSGLQTTMSLRIFTTQPPATGTPTTGAH